VISVTYSTVFPGGGGGPQAGLTYGFTWFKFDGGNSLNITSVSPTLDSTIVFHRFATTAVDGIWSWMDSGVEYVAQLDSGTFLAFNIDNNNRANTLTTVGTYNLYPNTPNNGIEVYITMSNSGGVTNSYENGSYAVTSTTLNLIDLYVEAAGGTVNLGPYTKNAANSIFDGVWSGFTISNTGAYCLTMAEFKNGLWRGYQTRCDASYSFGFGTFLGTYNQISSNVVNLTYCFTDFHGTPNAPDLVGSTLSFAFTANGNTLSLVGQGPTTIQLAKVVTIPSQQNLVITLQGDASTFIGNVRDQFVQDLADLLNIDPRNIMITDVRSGSIIVDVTILDDAKSGVPAAGAQSVISSQASIGGHPVTSVANETPGASSDATRMVVSWLVLAVVALVALWA